MELWFKEMFEFEVCSFLVILVSVSDSVQLLSKCNMVNADERQLKTSNS